MAVEEIGLDQIHDNPYQARLTYHRKDIDELAHSIKEHGLLQVPPGRRIDGDIEMAFGHLRKRAFDKLAKKDPEKWGLMPIDIRELSDEQMAMFALEENLKRRDISLLELARAVDHYLNSFLEKTEVELAESLNMTKGNVSNMRRVLRLPELFLQKINEGLITFTQGRELLTLEGLPNAKELMSSALAGINTTGNKSYSRPNTVEGLQQSIHSTINGHFPPLDKEWEGWRWDILFDTRATGCLECEKMVRTHPTKSQAAHFCSDEQCWQAKQEEHREKAAVAAKAKMEAEVLERVARDVAQRTLEPAAAYKMEKRGTSWIAIDDQGRVVAINHDKKVAGEIAKASFEPVATIVNPGADDYRLNHTYRFVEYPGSRKLENFDVTAQDLTTAAEALGADHENIELVKVWKSSGKLGTGGSVSAGWSKCTETFSEKLPGQVEAADEVQLEDQVDERDRQMEETRERANLERPVGEAPCDTCANDETCDRTSFHVTDDDSGRLVCEQWCEQAVPEDLLEQDISRRIAEAPARREIPEDILTLAKEKAGTRAEVLDLNDICTGERHWRQFKQGYADLSAETRYIDDPEECSSCTHGFHFAYDSKANEQRVINICSDTKCLAKKKSTATRKRNADGQARKKAEVTAVKEAIALTTTLDRGRLKLILLAQIKGKHLTRYDIYGNVKRPEKWLWDKVSAGVPENDRTQAKLFKAISKLSNEELSKLVVEFMFYYIMDHGDIGTYELQVEEPLGWMGITVELEEAKGQLAT